MGLKSGTICGWGPGYCCKNRITKDHAKCVFWLPVIIDCMLIFCEWGMLFGEISTVKRDFRHHCHKHSYYAVYNNANTTCVSEADCGKDYRCDEWNTRNGYDGLSECEISEGCSRKCHCRWGKSPDTVITSMFVFLILNFVMYGVKMSVVYYGGRSDLCYCDDAKDYDKSCFMSITDSAFICLTCCRPSKLKKLQDYHSEGNLRFCRSPIKYFDVLCRWLPFFVLNSVLAIYYGGALKYKWLTGWCVLCVVYWFTKLKRYQYNQQMKEAAIKEEEMKAKVIALERQLSVMNDVIERNAVDPVAEAAAVAKDLEEAKQMRANTMPSAGSTAVYGGTPQQYPQSMVPGQPQVTVLPPIYLKEDIYVDATAFMKARGNSGAPLMAGSASVELQTAGVEAVDPLSKPDGFTPDERFARGAMADEFLARGRIIAEQSEAAQKEDLEYCKSQQRAASRSHKRKKRKKRKAAKDKFAGGKRAAAAGSYPPVKQSAMARVPMAAMPIAAVPKETDAIVFGGQGETDRLEQYASQRAAASFKPAPVAVGRRQPMDGEPWFEDMPYDDDRYDTPYAGEYIDEDYVQCQYAEEKQLDIPTHDAAVGGAAVGAAEYGRKHMGFMAKAAASVGLRDAKPVISSRYADDSSGVYTKDGYQSTAIPEVYDL